MRSADKRVFAHVTAERRGEMRRYNGPGGRPVDVSVLRGLDGDSGGRAFTARELADALAAPVASISPKLQSLVRAGLAERHTGAMFGSPRTYSITDEGRNYLLSTARK